MAAGVIPQPGPRYIGAEEVAGSLSYPEAVDVLARAFAEQDPGAAPVRSHLEIPDGELLLMPAALAQHGAGIKLVTIAPGNVERGLPFIHGIYVLFAPATLTPMAILDGAQLTRLRTAAVSALATQRLARLDASRLVVFGAGAQARAHVDAMRAVRPIERVEIIGRDPVRAAALVISLRGDGVEVSLAGPDAVAHADIVCTCTTSREPLFAADRVPAGAHINAIGAYRPDARELDAALLARALIVVETRAAALAEAGDLVLAIADGALEEHAVQHELAAVVRGEVGRTDGDQVTVFKSVGLALEDLVLAVEIDRRARERGPES